MSASEPSPESRLPAVDRVLGWPVVAALIRAHGRALVVEAIRDELAAWRARPAGITDEAVAAGVSERLQALLAPSQRPVLNLTGTVLHTNLGRAPLPPEAIEAMVAVGAGASNLEYDLDRGRRGDRDDHVESWLCRLTGAEAATVVNNNAAAVLLTLNSLALRREVVVSRGELIEIGGAFRLPDIMSRAGCRLREVGTTNRTHAADYAEAIGERTALLLKAHTSNYRIEGFTADVPVRELAALGRERNVPCVEDLGSGTLVDLTRFGLPHEPTPAESLAAGADLVTFSGDKLLGGPQAGIIVGRADPVKRIRKNPMKRAMRCDRMTLAALEAVLRLYADPEAVARRVPAVRLLVRSANDIEAQAHRLRPTVADWVGELADVDVAPVQSQIGSGSLPVDLLPSFALRLTPRERSGRAPDRLARRLRALPVPVIGRVSEGSVLLDMRCLEDEAAFARAFDAARRA